MTKKIRDGRCSGLRKAVRRMAVPVAVAVLLALFLGAVYTADPPTPTGLAPPIRSRCQSSQRVRISRIGWIWSRWWISRMG